MPGNRERLCAGAADANVTSRDPGAGICYGARLWPDAAGYELDENICLRNGPGRWRYRYLRTVRPTDVRGNLKIGRGCADNDWIGQIRARNGVSFGCRGGADADRAKIGQCAVRYDDI